MITVRPSEERGRADFGWLDGRHSFSFGHYYDPRHMGFRTLRVINEDRVAGGGGFPTHPHANMEIVTYMIDGALEHRDSMGNGSVIRRGDVQRMSAGTGVQHSEFNASKADVAHLLQIWIIPERNGLKPEYEQKQLDPLARANKLRVLASPDGRDGGVTIHTDAIISGALLDAGTSIEHKLAPGRHAWIQLVVGAIDVNGQRLHAGDGAAISNESLLTLTAAENTEMLLFDLP